MVREIENVIFSYLDPTDTLNASSFEELRSIRTEAIRAEGDRLRDEVMRLIREECSLRDSAASLAEKKKRITTLIQERTGLEKQLPKAASPEEAQLQKDLQDKRQALAGAQQAAAVDKQKLQKIADIRARVTMFKAQAARFHTEVNLLLNEAGVAEADRSPFTPSFPADTEPPLVRREADLRKSIAQRDGAADIPAEGTIQWLQRQIQTLLQKDSADKARQEKITASRSGAPGAARYLRCVLSEPGRGTANPQGALRAR